LKKQFSCKFGFDREPSDSVKELYVGEVSGICSVCFTAIVAEQTLFTEILKPLEGNSGAISDIVFV
jgi:hypothetical protein